MDIKHYKKVVVKKVDKRCRVCDNPLTTIDMCYSKEVGKCWNCDKDNVEKDLFGLGPADFKKCTANCDTSEQGACLCFIEFMNKK